MFQVVVDRLFAQCHSCRIRWVFSSNDSFLFPCGFLDYWRFPLEVIWGRSPLKSRLNNFCRPCCGYRTDIVDGTYNLKAVVVQSVHVTQPGQNPNSGVLSMWEGSRGEAIILVKLSIILLAIPIILPIMLTDFTYYSQNYSWFNAHGVTDS